MPVERSLQLQGQLEASGKLHPIRMLADLFAKTTQEAAMAANDWSGRDKKEEADEAAVSAMRDFLNGLNIDGVIEVGEGIKDKAPMLYIGEEVGKINEGTGKRDGPRLSFAVDPIDGTKATAGLMAGAVSVLVAAEQGGILRLPEELFYVDKLIVGPQAKDRVDINAPVSENLKVLASSLRKNVSDLRITVLNRPRNQKLISQIYEAGAKVARIEYGDLMPGVYTSMEGSNIHAVMGIGGAPEAVLSAAGLICLDGGIQIKPWVDKNDPKIDYEATVKSLEEKGFGLGRVFNERDLVPGQSVIFSSSGITKGDVFKGVRTFVGGVRIDGMLLAAADGVSLIEPRDSTLVTDRSKIQYRLD